jgi:hypothetical protein
MRLEDDPTVKKLPSPQMRKRMCVKLVENAQKRAAKANQGA